MFPRVFSVIMLAPSDREISKDCVYQSMDSSKCSFLHGYKAQGFPALWPRGKTDCLVEQVASELTKSNFASGDVSLHERKRPATEINLAQKGRFMNLGKLLRVSDVTTQLRRNVVANAVRKTLRSILSGRRYHHQQVRQGRVASTSARESVLNPRETSTSASRTRNRQAHSGLLVANARKPRRLPRMRPHRSPCSNLSRAS